MLGTRYSLYDAVYCRIIQNGRTINYNLCRKQITYCISHLFITDDDYLLFRHGKAIYISNTWNPELARVCKITKIEKYYAYALIYSDELMDKFSFNDKTIYCIANSLYMGTLVICIDKAMHSQTDIRCVW